MFSKTSVKRLQSAKSCCQFPSHLEVFRFLFLSTILMLRLFHTSATYSTATSKFKEKPNASEVLTRYLLQRELPPWTSYFVKYNDIKNDQRGFSHFNWPVKDQNYHILRTGCYPYIKYHCTRRPHEDLSVEDNLFRIIKIMNLGLPCLAYGIAAEFLITHREIVETSKGNITIHFLYKEDVGAIF